MLVTLLAAVLAGVLLAAGLGGPWLLKRAAPALAAVPRVAAVALSLTALLWIVTLVALGPVVAWMSKGPAWMPQQASELCDRCLLAAAPFGESPLSIGIPAVVPLVLPLVGALLVIGGIVRELVRTRRAQLALAAAIADSSTAAVVLGHAVRVLDSEENHAFSLPHRDGGVVLARGVLERLSSEELLAVIHHERAHLEQRHHLLLAVLRGATAAFAWVPFVRAVRAAVAHSLEIAADQAAVAQVGSTALAGALLKLGLSAPPLPQDVGRRSGTRSGAVHGAAAAASHAVLHAAGSERIRTLVGEPRPPVSVVLASVVAGYAVLLAVAVATVHWPYVLTILTGC